MAQPAVTICSGCGVSSELHGAFHNEPNSIRKFCPPCWAKRDAANDRIYLGTYLFDDISAGSDDEWLASLDKK